MLNGIITNQILGVSMTKTYKQWTHTVSVQSSFPPPSPPDQKVPSPWWQWEHLPYPTHRIGGNGIQSYGLLTLCRHQLVVPLEGVEREGMKSRGNWVKSFPIVGEGQSKHFPSKIEVKYRLTPPKKNSTNLRKLRGSIFFDEKSGFPPKSGRFSSLMMMKLK